MAGIVLAGGLSSRMGSDKALLEFEGERLVERAVRIVGEVSQPVFVVADRAGKYALPGRVIVLGDDTPGAGPLGGVVTGLRAAGRGAHVVVACDMPHIRIEVLRLLLTTCAGFDAAVPHIGGRPEPLCAAYNYRCLTALTGAVSRGLRAMHIVLDSLSVAKVYEASLRAVDPDLISFTNINEPRDLARFARPNNGESDAS